MLRFLLLAVFSSVLLLGTATLAFDALDGGSFGRRLDGSVVLGGWLLEAMALTALFLLIQGRGGSWWLDGLLTAGLAWIFRGPVLVLQVAEVLGGSSGRWWQLSQQWLLIYALCGLLLAFLARQLGVRR
ncbi:MAG: hypothetical protein O7A98_00015 [Acidobacteria bacterium]|nr:hypothetical protein [Acidobacteriota bacterium]